MNILFVSAIYPWPLSSGGQVRVYELLKRLSKHHTITLVSYLRTVGEDNDRSSLRFLKKHLTSYRGQAWRGSYVIRSIVGQYPFLSTTYDNQKLRSHIIQELEKNTYDIVHIEPHYVYPVISDIHIPALVVGEHNIEYDVYRRFIDKTHPILLPFLSREVRRMKTFEQKVWKKANGIVAVSEEDARIIRNINKETYVVPNCVDTVKYPYARHSLRSHNLKVLFVGDFKWMQNRDALRFILKDLWPKIRTHFSHATLHIVGKDLPIQISKQITDVSISYHGYVPDIRTFYKSMSVLLAPIDIGGGTKYKILESFASGLPVIASQKATVGFGVKSGRELFVADTPDAYIQLLEKLIRQPDLVEKVTSNARDLVERKFSWDNGAYELDKIWNRVVSQTKNNT